MQYFREKKKRRAGTLGRDYKCSMFPKLKNPASWIEKIA